MNWSRGLSLDLKLGARMLARYPGLTIVGGLAMAFAICAGTVIFAVQGVLFNPSLPLPDGDRVVQIRNWDAAANRPEPRVLQDFLVWRDNLQSVSHLGAWRDVSRNLIVTEGDAGPVEVAEITSSAFDITGARPLLGRVLTPSDEAPVAPAVAVIGYDVWQRRFGGDPAVVGRSVQLGTSHVTIVGVMREGFGFPVAHDLWMPLRAASFAPGPRSGPAITVFGRLAPGATEDAARAELETLMRRAAIEQPETHQHLQAQVRPFANVFFSASTGDELGVLASIYFFSGALIALICGNVALLLFARAATRQSELAVRAALGASRQRIVTQLFAEALVLGGVAAAAGLIAAEVILRTWGVGFLEVNLGRLPFWMDLGLSPRVVLFAIGLTVLGSAIAGVVPALKVTRRMGRELKQATAGAGGLQFGGIWTTVIVLQVAVTVAFPAIVYIAQWQVRRVQSFEPGFAAEQYLAVRVQRDAPVGATTNTQADVAAERQALASSAESLRERLRALPAIAGVTFVDRLPLTARPEPIMELAALTGGGVQETFEATTAPIEPSYFDVLGSPLQAGRAFTGADLAAGANVAIVDQGFVDQVLGGQNPVGRHVRFVGDPLAPPNPWMEIVGIARDLGMSTPLRRDRAAGVYIPATPDRLDRVYLMAHVRGDPLTLGPQLSELAAAVDPALRLSEFQRVDRVLDDVVWFMRLWVQIAAMMTAVALLLSLSGIYAVLSFIVARRTREIGVRVALGASRSRVVTAIFRRPLIQVGLGVLAGFFLIAVAGSVETEMPGLNGTLSLRQLAILVAYTALMFAVCLLACIVPTRRALQVEPTVALRGD